MSYFDDNGYVRIPGKTKKRTKEGKAAYIEAIKFLEVQKPVGKLNLSDGLTKACRDHAMDLGPKGARGHTGTDGSSVSDRMRRYGQPQSTWGENLRYGRTDAGIDVIKSLLIDDGVADRGHRKNLFKEGYGVTGIYVGPHETYRAISCIDYAGSFKELNGSVTKLMLLV